jgi:hypothetical protein
MSKKTKQNSVVASLALSDLHIRLETLVQEHEWLLKQIKRKQTELRNFVEQMQNLAREMFVKSTPKMREMVALDQEIHKLFDSIFKRKFGKATLKKIEGIYENLQELGLISPEDSNQNLDDLDDLFKNIHQEDEDQEDEDQDPFRREQQKEITEESIKKNDAEAREIRQTFLRLAAIFHPDKVMDESSQMLHTEIMQEINRAYQEGDLAKLLEIEQKHEVGDQIDINNQDDLTRQCESLTKRNHLLKTQYEKLKEELRLVKNTPEGEMVSDYRRAKREKIDAIAEMIEQLEQQVNLIKDVRDFVKDFQEQKITIKKFLEGPKCFQQLGKEIMEELLEQMFSEMIDEEFDYF